MDTLNWDYDGHQYMLKTVHGKAIIVEVPDARKSEIIGAADKHKYRPRLELEDGTILEPTHFNEFDNFEIAEAYLIYNQLAPLDSRDQFGETLQYCASLLSAANTNPTHLQRLELVAETLNLPKLSLIVPPSEGILASKLTAALDWQEEDGVFRVQTQYGTATITETKAAKTFRYGGADSYQPSLKESSGALLRGLRFTTFEAAEEWLIAKLEELDHPAGDKADVESILYTLDICLKLLPDDSEPMHYIRLRTMQAEFSQIVL